MSYIESMVSLQIKNNICSKIKNKISFASFD